MGTATLFSLLSHPSARMRCPKARCTSQLDLVTTSWVSTNALLCTQSRGQPLSGTGYAQHSAKGCSTPLPSLGTALPGRWGFFLD